MFRTSAIAAGLTFFSVVACSPAGGDTAQSVSGPETGIYLTEVTFDDGPGVQRGAADAPVTMIEYASITCSHCRDFHKDVLSAGVTEDYVGTGKVKLIFREFPLNQIDIAGFAIARCAGEDKYFDVLDTFFEDQDAVIQAAQDGTVLEKLKEVGASFGLSEGAVDTCIEDSDVRRQIAASAEAGQADGVNSTPTIFLNGVRQETIESRSLDGMSSILDGLLGETDASDAVVSPDAN